MQAPQTLTLEPAEMYPSARDVRAAVQAGDWARTVWIMNQTDPSERTYLVTVAAGVVANGAGGVGGGVGGGTLAQRQLDERPDDPLAAAVLAQAMVDDAWEVRGGGRASTVTRETFATFHEMLQGADRVLHEAIAHHEDDPSLWTVSLGPAVGLGLGLSEAQYRYEQVRRLDPHVLMAQALYLQFLCPKWYGTWELASTFADSTARQSAPGSLDPVAVPLLHIERVIDTDVDTAAQYVRQSAMGAEVWQAAHHSVWSPQFVPRYGWVKVVHAFACAFALLGDQTNAVALLDRTGPYASENPWYYFGDPVEVIGKVRAGRPLREKKKGRRR